MSRNVLFLLMFVGLIIGAEVSYKGMIKFDFAPSSESRLIELVLDTKSLFDRNFNSEQICDEVKFTIEIDGNMFSLPYWLECCCYTDHTTYWINLLGSESERNIEIRMYIGTEGSVTEGYDDRNIQTAEIEIAFFSNETCPDEYDEYGFYWGNHMRLTSDMDFSDYLGGSNTHTHEASVVIKESDQSGGDMIRNGGTNDPYCPLQGHYHEISSVYNPSEILSEESSRLDSYFLHLCHYHVKENGYPGINPQFLVPSVDHARETETKGKYRLHNPYNGSFPAALYEMPGTGVYQFPYSDTHYHTTSDFETSDAIGVGRCEEIQVTETCTDSHTHDVEEQVMSGSSHIPPWISFPHFQSFEYLEKPFNGSIIPVTFTFSSDYVVPFFYEILTGYDFHYVRMMDQAFITGGEATHTHSIMYTGTVGDECEIQNVGTINHIYKEKLYHTHAVTIEADDVYNEPGYVTVVFLKRKIADLTYVIDWEEFQSNSWECFGEDFNSTDVCRSSGDCIGEDFCSCHPYYYGIICSEIFGKAYYEDSSTISIEYTVLVGDLEQYSWRNETIDQLFGDDDDDEEEEEEEESEEDYFDCELFIRDAKDLLGEDVECQFRISNIISTTHLVVYNSKSNIENVVLIPFTQTGVEIETEVGQYEDDGFLIALIFLSIPIISIFTLLLIFACCCCGHCLCCTFLCYGCCIFMVCNRSQKVGKKLKKVNKLDDLDVLLEEQKALKKSRDESRSSAKLKIRKELFEINYRDIKVMCQIGAGGSNSVVFKARWEGQTVAFKVFKTNDICGEQHKFDEFEREVQILASFSHPNILNFYGASVMQPRVGIVMEFCSRGDMLSFFPKYREENNGRRYPERIRMMTEIISAMSYLHENGVIHRDLKLENVLVTEGYALKVMDFGLSKVVERISQTMTKRIGTSLTMAPEVTRGDSYTPACDVFSFGVMCYQTLTYIMDPYGKNIAHNLEFKVANNSHFRPPLDGMNKDGIKIIFGSEVEAENYVDDEEYNNKKEKKRVNRHQWIVNLIQKMWDDDPEERPSFEELKKAFEEKKDYVERLDQRKKIQSVEEANMKLNELKNILVGMNEENMDLKEKKKSVLNQPLLKQYFREQRKVQHEKNQLSSQFLFFLDDQEEEEEGEEREIEVEEEGEEMDSGDEEVVYSSSSSSSSSAASNED